MIKWICWKALYMTDISVIYVCSRKHQLRAVRSHRCKSSGRSRRSGRSQCLFFTAALTFWFVHNFWTIFAHVSTFLLIIPHSCFYGHVLECLIPFSSCVFVLIFKSSNYVCAIFRNYLQLSMEWLRLSYHVMMYIKLFMSTTSDFKW